LLRRRGAQRVIGAVTDHATDIPAAIRPAALLTVTLDGGIVFMVALSHSGPSIQDLMQLNTVFTVILAAYAAVTYLGWKRLPAGSVADA
jgi:hypothetical protein